MTLGNPELTVLSLPVLIMETLLPQKISIVRRKPLQLYEISSYVVEEYNKKSFESINKR